MEPETTAVLRKDVAGWVADGTVTCRRSGLSTGVDVRYMQVAPGAFRMRIRPVQRRSIKGSYLGACIFISFCISICYLFLSFMSPLPFFLLPLLLFMFTVYFYSIRFCIHLSVKCIKPAVLIMSTLSH
jgi:hypothetical protein